MAETQAKNQNAGAAEHRTYYRSRGPLALLKEYWLLTRRAVSGSAISGRSIGRSTNELRDKLRETYGIELEGKDILDVGAGQRYPMSYVLSNNNNCVAMDLDVIGPLGIGGHLTILRRNGPSRLAKTIGREILCDRTYYKSLRQTTGVKGPGSVRFVCGSCDNTDFPDASFDCIISSSVLEHVEDVPSLIKEMKRLLRPGGVMYHRIHHFACYTGGHQLGLYLEDDRVPAWEHLRNPDFYSHTYLNKLRIDDYKKIFLEHFPDAVFELETRDREKVLPKLEPVRHELASYSDDELLAGHLIVMARQPSE